MTWDSDAIAELTWWRVVGCLSFTQVAKRMGITKNAAISRFKHHVEGKVYANNRAITRKTKPEGRQRNSSRWSEEFLTEPYAARKRRLAAERSADA